MIDLIKNMADKIRNRAREAADKNSNTTHDAATLMQKPGNH